MASTKQVGNTIIFLEGHLWQSVLRCFGKLYYPCLGKHEEPVVPSGLFCFKFVKQKMFSKFLPFRVICVCLGLCMCV